MLPSFECTYRFDRGEGEDISQLFEARLVVPLQSNVECRAVVIAMSSDASHHAQPDTLANLRAGNGVESSKGPVARGARRT